MSGVCRKMMLVLVCSVSAGANAGPRLPFMPERPPERIFKPGHHVSRIPRGAVSLVFGGVDFFFHAGLFYTWTHGDYVVTTPPTGIVVPVLPAGCAIEKVDGVNYYVLQGSYYRRVAGGYVVVDKPAPLTGQEAPPMVTVQHAPVTVWVENANGSRTPVEIKPAETGQWVGPKGEYYDQFPGESQLAPVYGLTAAESDPDAAAEAAETQTFWITNLNGSKTPVELKKAGNGKWEGPNGEVYDSLPTEAELSYSYGLRNR